MKNKTSLTMLYTHEKRALAVIVLLALALRVALVLYLESYKISSDNNSWTFGFEEGRVARAIASGDGFSAPFEPGRLPTAWVAPVYPFILSLVFEVFGIYSQRSAFTILIINSLFSSLTCVVMYYIAKSVMNARVGLVASIIFAVYPPAIWHSINTIWDTTLSALLIAVLILYAITILKKLNYPMSIIGGALMGLTTLTNPVIIAFYPFYLFWVYLKLRGSGKKAPVYMMMIIFSFLVIISPWLIRNYLIFHKFVFIKSTLGVELRLGNNQHANGTFTMEKGSALHPTLSKTEMDLFNNLKETGYVEYCSREAWNFIFKNPLKVLSLTVKRFYLFWLGELLKENTWMGNIKNVEKLSVLKEVFYILPVPFFLFGTVMAWRNGIDIALFLYLLLSYPLVYYFTHISNRYRHPIEPFILIIGIYGIHVLYEKFRVKCKSRIVQKGKRL